MSDVDPTHSAPAADPAAQHRARIALAILLVLVIAGGVGGYFGWKTYRRHQDEALAARIEAEGGVNAIGPRARPPRPPLLAPNDAQNIADAMARRDAALFEKDLAAFKQTPEAGRDAFIEGILAANRGNWRRIIANAPASNDPAAADLVARAKARFQRGAATRPAPRPAPNPARPRPAATRPA